MAYTPPELVATTTVHVGSAGPSTLSDAFSFGLLAAELFSNRQVLAVSSSVAGEVLVKGGEWAWLLARACLAYPVDG